MSKNCKTGPATQAVQLLSTLEDTSSLVKGILPAKFLAVSILSFAVLPAFCTCCSIVGPYKGNVTFYGQHLCFVFNGKDAKVQGQS